MEIRVVFGLSLLFCATISANGEIRGDAEAVTAAKRLLEHAGGADAWRSPYFEVTERVHLSSGETANMRVVRDLARFERLTVSERPGRKLTEWISADGGWVDRNGAVTPMSGAQHAAERQGLRQEPYAIYHRIALGDSRLRAELRDNGRIFFFDEDERILCWFQVAPNGVELAWGNFYDGAINEAYYGPTVNFGPVRLPRFGISTTGSIRFEYVSARFLTEPPAEPQLPQPVGRGD